MKAVFIAFAFVVVCTAALSDSQVKSALLDVLKSYNTYASTILSDRINDQSRVANLDNYIHALKKERNTMQNPQAPLRQPYKIMTPSLANLISKAKEYTTTAVRDHTHVPNTSTSELMLMRGLQQKTKSANRALRDTQQMPSDTSRRLASLESLVSTMDRITRNLQSPEKEATFQHAHAQSRMLHRLDHMLDKTNGRLEEAKQRKFENMMNTMMHYHLNDPHYYDELHDHLLAHHLSRARDESDFADHVAHNILYNRLGTHLADEDQLNNYIATTAARDLATQSRTNHLNQLHNRITSAAAAATTASSTASSTASTTASTTTAQQ